MTVMLMHMIAGAFDNQGNYIGCWVEGTFFTQLFGVKEGVHYSASTNVSQTASGNVTGWFLQGLINQANANRVSAVFDNQGNMTATFTGYDLIVTEKDDHDGTGKYADAFIQK